MPVDSLSDEDLLVRFRASTETLERDLCINELFKRNYSRVARWCLRFSPDRESAADLAQEVFVRAYKSIDAFQGQSKFSTWLFTIARNHCLNALRGAARQATELRADVDEDFLAEIPDVSPNQQDALEQQAQAREVAQLLTRTLDETERAVFTLHYGEDVPLDAITRILGLGNASGAKAYIVSAKRKLARFVSRNKTQV